MPIDRPSLAELSRRAEAELTLETASEALRRNLFTPLARALAGGVNGLYAYQDWTSRQLFPQSCDDDILEQMHAPIWVPEGRTPAAPASGTVSVTGAAGAALDQGVIIQRADGVAFVLAEGVILPAGGSANAKVVCATPGAAGNTEPGGKLRLVNPAVGVNGELVVLAPGLSGGADLEGIESLRERVIAARSRGGDTGTPADFEAWAREVAGVTRAWAIPHHAGIGTTVVFFVRDNDADPFPDSNEVASVTNHLRSEGTPFGEVHAAAPLNKPVNFQLSISPDTPAIRAAAQAALLGVLAREAAPIDRDKLLAGLKSGITIPRSHFTEALSAVLGEQDHALTLPAGNVACAVGELATLGNVAWS